MQAFSKHPLFHRKKKHSCGSAICPFVFFPHSLFHFMLKMRAFNFLCGWIPALFEFHTHTPLYLNLRACTRVLLHAMVPLPSWLSPALLQTHTCARRHIGFVRALHTSASLDSSLKCPWQPPNPEPSFPLCSHTFSSLPEPLMDVAIFLCLSPLECSHNHWAL